MSAIPYQQSSSHGSYHEPELKGQVTLTLDERRRAALEEIDNAPFSWFHIKVCLVASVGFFTDAYDIFAINIAATMLGYVYGHTSNQLNANQSLGVKVATPVGTLIGQLLFGWLADVLGRKRMYGVELVLMIVATFGQALTGQAPAVSAIGVIIVWRVIMGVGVGGDYPMSAIISSEFAASRSRGRLMTAVFAAQGWGQLAAAIVGTIVVRAYKTEILNAPFPCAVPVDYTWRLLIGLGCIPAVIALYFRLTIPETPRFTMDVERNVAQATADITDVLAENRATDNDIAAQRVAAPKATLSDFATYFGQWKNMKILIGTSYSWFALDIAFYGLGLNSSIILTAINFGSPTGNKTSSLYVYQNLYNVCIGNIILSVAGLIPGYWVSFLFIDSWGRKPIQLMGFSILTILFIIMGFAYDALDATTSGRDAFVFLYCLTNFFQNFGPNTTTFVIPGEAFPTRYRSTAYGISAASGKLGAIISQVGFAQLINIGGTNRFVQHIMEIFAAFMLTGVISTLLISETKQRTLEDISNEEQEGYIKEAGNVTRS
ncbi:major facilitator superfamily domain-containing protein [Suillus bovinus]|uniref:major facilitator superfamily domain-containing protein n=1 Tax=Suillus bovinus TaxID=48563 RepID=UPI001B883738|nr:major facilitator superfamily domain-containing protein [Suillus bovinus]KAG2149045.1 major facilitator superfamily domain-containing protein [Suillus bovinus]